VTLDLTRPEHRDALRWAASYRALYGDAGASTAEERGGLSMDAWHALSSPSDSAAIVRALLEGCGVDVSLQPMGKESADPNKQAWLWWAEARAECPAYIAFRCMHDVKPLRFVTMTELPGLVLALLACASVAAAISALRDADKP
jgi:hypothetical protein